MEKLEWKTKINNERKLIQEQTNHNHYLKTKLVI